MMSWQIREGEWKAWWWHLRSWLNALLSNKSIATETAVALATAARCASITRLPSCCWNKVWESRAWWMPPSSAACTWPWIFALPWIFCRGRYWMWVAFGTLTPWGGQKFRAKLRLRGLPHWQASGMRIACGICPEDFDIWPWAMNLIEAWSMWCCHLPWRLWPLGRASIGD